jgi:predicted RND superfamily exporter protein
MSIWGAIVAVPLLMRDSNPMPPVQGTESYEARNAFEFYFPYTPVDAALFVEASPPTPLLAFTTNRSTCNLQHNLSGGQLTFACHNESALGGGCITKADFVEGVVSTLRELLKGVMKPEEVAEVIQGQIVPSIEQDMPDVTSCPEEVDGGITQKWLSLASKASSMLETSVPACKHTVLSPLTIEEQVSKSNFDGGMSIVTKIPAGTFWSLQQKQFVSSSLKHGIIGLQTHSCNGAPISPESKVANELSAALKQVEAPSGLVVKVSTLSLLMDATLEGIENSMFISTMTVPVALAIVAMMVGNIRLVVCCALNLFACLLSSIAIVDLLQLVMDVNMFAPTLMVAVALGMSIDYSLFLLARFQQELCAGQAVSKALEIMLGTSGRVVIVSGSTLMLCFVCMLVVPLPMVRSLGSSAAITVLTAMLATLMMTPAIILSFPDFFSSDRRWGCNRDSCCLPRERCCVYDCLPLRCLMKSLGSLTFKEEDGASGDIEKDAKVDPEDASCWQHFGVAVHRFAMPILVIYTLCVVSVGVIGLPNLEIQLGMTPFLPEGSEATETLLEVSKTFGDTVTYPTRLLLVLPEGAAATEINRTQWLSHSCAALKSIAAEVNVVAPDVPAFSADAFSGVMISGGYCVTTLLPEIPGVAEWSHEFGNYTATIVHISYGIDQFSSHGQHWMKRLRKALANHTDVGTWYIDGEALQQMDMAELAYSYYPFMTALMLIVVFILMLTSSKSIIAPLRAVAVLVGMLAMTYGLMAICKSATLSWLTPLLNMPMLIGLGLDYDIFYTEAVAEKWETSSPRAASVGGLASTANTISAAGVIMVASFTPLMLSRSPLLQHLGFLLTIGVAIDCLLTTKVIVPAAISVLGRLSFWPRSHGGSSGGSTMVPTISLPIGSSSDTGAPSNSAKEDTSEEDLKQQTEV